jgi:hypothetical protein
MGDIAMKIGEQSDKSILRRIYRASYINNTIQGEICWRSLKSSFVTLTKVYLTGNSLSWPNQGV